MITILSPWWRPDPFTNRERRLLDALLFAHHLSAQRDNPSTITAMNAAFGSGSLPNGIAAALISLGGPHAPIEETVDVIRSEGVSIVERYISSGKKVPGWGGSFQKDGTDPIWMPVEASIVMDFPDAMRRLEGLTAEFHRLGKIIYPNPSAYTSITSIILGMPPKMAPILFIAGRLAAWAQLISK